MRTTIVGIFVLIGTNAFAQPVTIYEKSRMIGSGVTFKVIDNKTLVLSARHVCDGTTELTASTPDGSTFSGRILRRHAVEDVCLIELNGILSTDEVANTAIYASMVRAYIETDFACDVRGHRYPILVVGRNRWEERNHNFILFLGHVQGGMSGSPVYNEYGEIVGIVILSAGYGFGGFVELQYILEIIEGVNTEDYETRSHTKQPPHRGIPAPPLH